MKKTPAFLLPIIAVLLGWECISQFLLANNALFPPPSEVVVALWHMTIDGTIIGDAAASLVRLCAGLLIGITAGIFIGFLTGRSKRLETALSPLIAMFRPLPPVAIIPLVIVWLGIGDAAKIFSISFATFFPVWIAVHSGAKLIPRAFLWTARLAKRSRAAVFLRVLFPATLPYIVPGVRTSIGLGFVMVFVSELAGASSGLGYRISVTSLAYRIDQMIAALFVLALLGALADRLFLYAIAKLFPWTKLSPK